MRLSQLQRLFVHYDCACETLLPAGPPGTLQIRLGTVAIGPTQGEAPAISTAARGVPGTLRRPVFFTSGVVAAAWVVAARSLSERLATACFAFPRSGAELILLEPTPAERASACVRQRVRANGARKQPQFPDCCAQTRTTARQLGSRRAARNPPRPARAADKQHRKHSHVRAQRDSSFEEALELKSFLSQTLPQREERMAEQEGDVKPKGEQVTIKLKDQARICSCFSLFDEMNSFPAYAIQQNPLWSRIRLGRRLPSR